MEIYEAGQEVGVQKDIREGQKEGRDEMLAAIVHHMRASHLLEEIADLTGVSAEQVRAVW